jgi:hypothetical protein
MLKAALAAQRRGFHIFPVAAGAKIPHRLSSVTGPDGLPHGWGETATSDLNQIIHFWTQVDPRANIGIACKPSQLLVVDLDQAKEDWNLRGTAWEYLHQGYGSRVDGDAVLDEMAFKEAGIAPYTSYLDTYTVRTGSGGHHLYYWWPTHWPRISQASPIKGVVDVRGNGGQFGGYVLGEGSVTEAGPYRVSNDFTIQLAPEWIRRLVAEKPQAPKMHRPQGLRQPGAISWSGLVDSVRHAGEGNRNNALLWAARSMCTDGATEAEAQATLGPAAEEAGLPSFEVERTIESAYRVQRQKEGS